MYIFLLISEILGWSFVPSPVPYERIVAFQYLTSDSVLLDIYEYYDSTGILEGYTSPVKTPVCEDRLCYDVALDFYWDPLGDFSHFSWDSKNPLTKLDHVPF